MRRTVLSALALSFVTALAAAGCSPSPSADANESAAPAGADDVKPVAPPAELVGKWRLEVTEGKSSRTAVYHFSKDGRVEIDTRIDTPDLKTTDHTKRAVIKVEKDRVTVIDLSRTAAGGAEEVIPAERRRTRSYQIQVKGDELQWTEVDEAGKPVPQAKPVVLKRIKE